MKDTEFNKIMEIIVNALKERGYNPYMQLYGEDGLSFSYTQISTANDPMVNIDNEHSKHYKKKVDDLELYIADFCCEINRI